MAVCVHPLHIAVAVAQSFCTVKCSHMLWPVTQTIQISPLYHDFIFNEIFFYLGTKTKQFFKTFSPRFAEF